MDSVNWDPMAETCGAQEEVEPMKRSDEDKVYERAHKLEDKVARLLAIIRIQNEWIRLADEHWFLAHATWTKMLRQRDPERMMR